MDGLALLCNLFADGPVTLKRLRAARVANLSDLEGTAPERLADWLHASVPQARAFVEEARKLVRRLAETESPAAPRRRAPPVASASASGPRPHLPRPSRTAGGLALQPGLLPGLDESACTRLALHQVRTVQALSESAGLALARRTGIPYSTLLELSRRARRMLADNAAESLSPGEAVESALVEHELVPFVRRQRVAPRESESELERNDEFTLPVEPESAGPFG